MSASDTKTTTSNTKFTTDIVRSYLRDIVRVPLLTHEEEILYSKQVQQMIALQEKKETLKKQLNHEPTQKELAEYVQLSEKEVKEIFQQGAQGKAKDDGSKSAFSGFYRQKISETKFRVYGFDSGRFNRFRTWCREI